MYLSRLHNIISTDARNTSAQRVGQDRTGLCEHAPSIQHVNNSELRENASYESILYFTHHKTLKCNLHYHNYISVYENNILCHNFLLIHFYLKL